jgi:AraC-like DNA-binding protein
MEFFNASGDDLDEAVAVFSENYNLPAIEVARTERPFRWSQHGVGDARLSYRATENHAMMAAEIGPSSDFIVEWYEGGTLSFESGRTKIEVAPATPFVLPSGPATMLGRGTDTNSRLVHINKEFVHTVAEELIDRRFVTFQVAPAGSRALMQSWRRTVKLVAAVLFDNTATPSSLLREEMARLVAVGMLNTFPFESTGRPGGSSGPEPASVQAAYEFVHQNADRPITTDDIAVAAGLSVRSLHYALRRYRETTPMGILRGVRLERAHGELLVADPKVDSVTAIARQWGFLHLGRFSAAHFARFGELPSQTLRDARRSS